MGYRTCPWCGAQLPTSMQAVSITPGSQIDFGWGTAVIGQLLGEGGMGAVYHAWLHPRGGAGVQPPVEGAVKVLHPTFAQQGRVRELFANEARILATLAHPNVVSFYGIADVGGTSAIAIEFVKGETLGHLIDRKVQEAQAKKHTVPPGVRVLPCLPFDRAWHYFQQLLGGLAATHALGIVHRDVKPDNLLIRVDGVAKLTDFGIARVPANVAAATGNMIAGTVAYMSPEQIQGKPPLDARSDLYSAGVLLYEMLTGQLPFPIDDRSDWLVACDHVQTPPPPLRKLLPQAPLELEMLIAKAMAKNPADRFQTAVDFGDTFRIGLGLPTNDGWRAQQAMAGEAKKIATAVKLGRPLAESADLHRARLAVSAAYQLRP
jgi:eukaryotic-like serine/threonine-protein kinase